MIYIRIMYVVRMWIMLKSEVLKVTNYHKALLHDEIGSVFVWGILRAEHFLSSI